MKIVDDITKNIGKQLKFDAAIFLVKSTDYRITMPDILTLKAIKNFLENF